MLFLQTSALQNQVRPRSHRSIMLYGIRYTICSPQQTRFCYFHATSLECRLWRRANRIAYSEYSYVIKALLLLVMWMTNVYFDQMHCSWMEKSSYVMGDKIITHDETSTSQNRLPTSKIVIFKQVPAAVPYKVWLQTEGLYSHCQKGQTNWGDSYYHHQKQDFCHSSIHGGCLGETMQSIQESGCCHIFQDAQNFPDFQLSPGSLGTGHIWYPRLLTRWVGFTRQPYRTFL